MRKVELGNSWNHVIFLEEKKFNLDGPEGFSYYWHDLRKEKRIFSKRQQGGEIVMIWAAFSGEEKTSVAYCPLKMTSKDYINVLEKHFLPFWLDSNQNST